MDATRATYSVHEIAAALGITPVTIYAWRRQLAAEGLITVKAQYTYKECLAFVRLRKSRHPGKTLAPNKSELLKRQLRTDGFIR